MNYGAMAFLAGLFATAMIIIIAYLTGTCFEDENNGGRRK